MSTGAVITMCIAVFVYIEVAIGFGFYMFVITSKKMPDADKNQERQIKKYSIVAGVAFPVTLAILVANKVAGGR